MQPLKAGDTIAARIDGAAVTLTIEERQYVEPAMYAHEAGSGASYRLAYGHPSNAWTVPASFACVVEPCGR